MLGVKTEADSWQTFKNKKNHFESLLQYSSRRQRGDTTNGSNQQPLLSLGSAARYKQHTQPVAASLEV